MKNGPRTCPTCARPIIHDAAFGDTPNPGASAAFPFCSPKCKLADLGRWLDGSYRLAGPPIAMTDEEDA